MPTTIKIKASTANVYYLKVITVFKQKRVYWSTNSCKTVHLILMYKDYQHFLPQMLTLQKLCTIKTIAKYNGYNLSVMD